ncbi:MAG: hypothetical protein ACM3VS_01540 [Candidatus Dadabacteria bacterium]
MKLTIPISKLLLFCGLGLFLFLGCRKEESDSLSNVEEEQAATDATEAEVDNEFAFDDVFNSIMGVNNEVGTAGVGIFGRIKMTERLTRPDSITCFNVNITPLQAGIFPKTITVDFGNGCYTKGHTRYGKITTVYTGRLTVPGNSATTSFHDYKIDSFSVQGSQKIVNTTQPGSLQRQYTVDVMDAKLSKPNGNYSQWSSHRVISQIEGSLTDLTADDVFNISGSAHGKTRNRDHIYAWNSEIIQPLRKRYLCSWISSGKIKVARETLSSNSPWISILDYGQGDCDNKATLTINGITHQITLH